MLVPGGWTWPGAHLDLQLCVQATARVEVKASHNVMCVWDAVFLWIWMLVSLCLCVCLGWLMPVLLFVSGCCLHMCEGICYALCVSYVGTLPRGSLHGCPQKTAASHP